MLLIFPFIVHRNEKAESGLKFLIKYSQTNSFFASTYTDLCTEFAKKVSNKEFFYTNF